MAKHFTLDITDNHFAFARKTEEIAVEAALDGIYVVRTSLASVHYWDTETRHLGQTKNVHLSHNRNG
jgi:hypothetical protein